MTTEVAVRRRRTMVIAVLLALGLVSYGYNRVRNAVLWSHSIMARVNGQAIYEAQVTRGCAPNSFTSIVKNMEKDKLERVIAQVAIRQFLDQHGVRVQEARVDQEIRKLEKNPPSLGCPCCTYATLEDYLRAQGDTREDLRLELRGNLGLSEYAQASWQKSHPDRKSQLKEIGEQSASIRRHYVSAWQIFFNTFQQPGYNSDPDRITKAAGRKARKAWARLQQGESFEAVAKSVSEDMTSNREGGALGFIDRSTYGDEVAKAISGLEPGRYSKPIQSSWGYHIIIWKPMSEDDIVAFCESYLVDKDYKDLRSQIVKDARVERRDSAEHGSSPGS